MKKIRIPPTNALKSLEAVARHLSFTRAAKELSVSQSAVSHQIKHIEDLWGFPLFEKRGRQIILAEQGHIIVPIIRDFLRKLEATLIELSEIEETENTSAPALRVTLLQAMAFKWLIPRLGQFNHAYPTTPVWIATSSQLVDFNDNNADVGIRLGYGNWSGLYEERLMQEQVFPVCSKRFLEQHGQPKTPQDLLDFPLLRRSSVDILQRWRDWFHDAGVTVQRMPKGIAFPDSGLALQAAIDDRGVVLARSAHVLEDIKAGRLVRLFPEIKSISNIYYFFVCLQGRENEPEITAFRQWLEQEAQQTMREFEEFL